LNHIQPKKGIPRESEFDAVGISGAFIQRNPRQIKKSLETLDRKQSPQVFLHWLDGNFSAQGFSNTNLEKVVRSLTDQANYRDASLLILARYNHLLPDRPSIKALNRPLRSVIALMFQHHPNGTRAHFR